MTGAWTFNKQNITTTSTDGIVLSNTTSALVGSQSQYSPRIRWSGTVYNGTASKVVEWIGELKPVAGGTTHNLVFSSQTDAGGYQERFSLNNSNGFGFGTVSSPYFSGSSSGTVNITAAGATLVTVNDGSNNGYFGAVGGFISGGLTNSLGIRGLQGISFARGDGTAKMFVQKTSGNITIGTSTDAGANSGVLQVGGSVTVSSAIAKGIYAANTLVAAANNDVLVGLDIAPTFTNSTFTGVSNLSIRTNSNIQVTGGIFTASSMYASSTFGLVLAGTTGSTSDLALTDRSGNVALKVTNGGGLVIGATTIGSVRVGQAFNAGTSQITDNATYGCELGSGQGTVFDASIWDRTGANVLAIKNGGAVKIGAYNGTYDASAKLEVQSVTSGFLPPKMTTTQRDAISSPSAGLMVYDTTVNKVSVYNGTTWKYLLYE